MEKVKDFCVAVIIICILCWFFGPWDNDGDNDAKAGKNFGKPMLKSYDAKDKARKIRIKVSKTKSSYKNSSKYTVSAKRTHRKSYPFRQVRRRPVRYVPNSRIQKRRVYSPRIYFSRPIYIPRSNFGPFNFGPVNIRPFCPIMPVRPYVVRFR